MAEKELLVRPETGELVEYNQPVALTQEGIDNIQKNIAMAEKLVMTVLEMDVDYGIHPGTSSMALRDPGASKICNAFNCYPAHTILFNREDEDLISFLVEANLIHRKSKEVVANGVGGCSTNESKYGFRWVFSPTLYGYEPEGLRTKTDDGKVKYRIPNPDVLDLGNTIFKMAAKRAEIDACQNLPGVASALRKLFDPKLKQKMGNDNAGETHNESPISSETDYGHFWGMVKGMGLTENTIHAALEVKSMKDWINAGHTLDEAIILIGKKLADIARKATGVKTATNVPKEYAEPIDNREPGDITALDIPTSDSLAYFAFKFWKLDEKKLWPELGYGSRGQFDASGQTPWDGFLNLKAVHNQ